MRLSLLAAKRSQFQNIPKRDRDDVFKTFKFYVDQTIEAVKEWNIYLDNHNLNIQELAKQNAKNIHSNYLYDAIITSPPYINAIDYIWATKFELHWLEMVKSNQERLDLYTQEIGTERIPKIEYQELAITGNNFLDSLLADIYYGKKYQATKGQNQLRSKVVYKYFMDMKQHFISSFKHLKSGGYYCFVIGDINKICGVDIPVAQILIELACEIGFNQEFCFNLLLKNRRLNLPRNVQWAGTIKHDVIIVLQKP